MKCHEFNDMLAAMQNLDRLTPEMHRHMETCASCRETFQKTALLLDFIAEERAEKVSPFLNTRILSKIDIQRNKPQVFKPVYVTVMSVFLIVLGFLSASVFQNQSNKVDGTEIIASEYYFNNNAATQIEEIWFNNYIDE